MGFFGLRDRDFLSLDRKNPENPRNSGDRDRDLKIPKKFQKYPEWKIPEIPKSPGYGIFLRLEIFYFRDSGLF